MWTGRQALEQGLVDELGGFEVALRRAKESAGLKPERWYPIVAVRTPRQHRLPLPYPSSEGTLLAVMAALRALGRERVWALPPWTLRILGS